MEILITRILDKVSGVSVPQQKFVVILFVTIVVMRGKVTFCNLSRYSELSEKTYSRQCRKSFGFAAFNAHLIAEAIPSEHEQVDTMDCSFVPKSGKQTYGLDRFHDSSHDQAAQGLEVSHLAVIEESLMSVLGLDTTTDENGS